jgi:hypothetical protein
VDVSLEAMQTDPSLHRKFREGGQAIIFNANDFADPSSSEVFRILNGTPALRDSAKKLAAICGGSIASVPTLTDFKAGRNISTPMVPPIGAPGRAAAAQVYIGAFTVIDAKDFNAVLAAVGQKIELIGQIVSVKLGVGKRGRGRGNPYVFINFGIWNKNSVKITIWSEGLGNMSTRPTEAWVGKYISVTGLIEPPYEGKHYGKPYRNVGITVTSDNQIIHISEQDAKFRLGRRAAQRFPEVADDPVKIANRKILEDLRGGAGSGAPIGGSAAQNTPPRSPPPNTRNQQILGRLQSEGVGGQQYSPQPSIQKPGPGLLSRILSFIVRCAARVRDDRRRLAAKRVIRALGTRF